MDGTPLTSEFDQEQSTLVRPPKVEQTRKFPVIGCAVVGLLALIAVGVAVVVIFLVRDSSKGTANQAGVNNTNVTNVARQDDVNKQLANLQQQQADIDKQKQQLANEQKKLENQNNKPPVNAFTPPPANDPPTARITFHRGSVQETVTGSVIKKRSYVLRTLAGQFLSASLRSGGNCVVFSNGSTSESYETNEGDSSLVVVNNCSSAANYSLTVSVR